MSDHWRFPTHGANSDGVILWEVVPHRKRGRGMDIDDSRMHVLEGAANFRDLGGFPTADGRQVRRGRLFRSDVLYRLTDADMEALRALGIRTVIDLRSEREVRTYGIGPLDTPDIRHVNVPLVDDATAETATLADVSIGLLRHLPDAFRSIVGHLAEGPFPLVLTCFAGKDRTGIASALILGALGVSRRDIVADYALSERHMARLMGLHATSNPDYVRGDPLPDWLLATPATMEAILTAIDEEWGSIRGYLASIGVPSDELDRFAGALIEPA
jgi:protein-tyrosine phosphatase